MTAYIATISENVIASDSESAQAAINIASHETVTALDTMTPYGIYPQLSVDESGYYG